MSQLRAIGIEFRASCCAVALWQANEASSELIISNAQHSRFLPSYVAYTDSGVLVGHEAFNQRQSNPENTIYDIPTLLSWRFDDALLQQQMKNWPFKVVSNDNKPMIEVTVKGEKKQLFPEAIAAALLTSLKESAEAYLGVAPTNTVISVPTCASHLYRTALRDACNIAGLSPLRLMPELTATVIGCYLHAPTKKERDVVVINFGRSSLSACSMTVDDGIFEALAIADDLRVSGTEIDARLASYFAKHFTAAYEKNITGSWQAMHRLRAECERAKISLSTAVEATVAIEVEGTVLTGRITRAEFEALIMDLVAMVPQNLDRVLRDARRSIERIREVILCGGSSFVPCFHRAVIEFFSNSRPQFTRPDPAGSLAALAAKAAILAGDKSQQLQDMVFIEVSPFSIGLPSGAGFMTVLIPRNSSIPCRKSQIVATSQDNQQELNFSVFAGERAMAKDNTRLFEVVISGFMPAPRGVATVELNFEIDANGIICFSAFPRQYKAASLSIQFRNTMCITVAQLERLRDEELAASVRRTAAADARQARRELQAQVDAIWQLIERDEPPRQLLTYDRDALRAAVTETRGWLTENAAGAHSAVVFREKQRAFDERVRRVPASSFGPAID